MDGFLTDRETGNTYLATVATDGTLAEQGGGAVSISDDGTSILLDSASSDLVADDHNDKPDFFVRDLDR